MAEGTGAAPGSLDWGIGHYETTAAQLEPAARVVVEQAAVQPGEHLLDLGCGTGNAALLAAGPGVRAIGVDPSPRLLEVARAGRGQRCLHHLLVGRGSIHTA
jgi:cyclopropane fatty-acyl-phospholipid synthase-like methyltransferase